MPSALGKEKFVIPSHSEIDEFFAKTKAAVDEALGSAAKEHAIENVRAGEELARRIAAETEICERLVSLQGPLLRRAVAEWSDAGPGRQPEKWAALRDVIEQEVKLRGGK